MESTLSEHNQHYAPGNIDAALSAALVALNKDNAALGIEDLAGLDQFHTGGIQATRALAKRAAIKASDRVLDIGGGLGGPARLLAHEIGCHVTVVDLTEAYCRVGEQLTSRANLTEQVIFQQGNALDLPFEDRSFDVVWTQHSSMNIADKARLYAQIHRVLRPGGRLALHEVTTGSGEAIHFPALWARSETMNFLVPPDEFLTTVTKAGFQELVWEDTSNWSLAWFQERQRVRQAAGVGSNPLGLHLLLGDDFSSMIHNHIVNLQQGRIRIVEGIFERV